MSSGLAVEKDPYALPMPTPDSPVILPQWISGGNAYSNSRYQEAVWSLAPLIDNPSIALSRIWWRNCPEPLREQVKLATWTMINGQLRPSYLKARASAARSRTSARDMLESCREWMRLARWLHKQDVVDLSACTQDMWRTYVSYRCEGGLSRSYAEALCGRLSDLWAFDQISARPAGLTRPPWDTEGIDDFLPAVEGTDYAENTREPLDPRVLGPLLVWAIRFVDDFADDILAAWAENRRLTALAAANKSTPESLAAAKEYLLARARGGGSLPSVCHQGQTRLATTYVAAATGASLNQIDRLNQLHKLSDTAAQRPEPCPMEIPVTGLIDGKPWREHMDFTEAPTLMRHLGTAAMIICLYLTGMRPQEVQGLRSGCCPDPEPAADGSVGRHLIRGHHYKNVTNDDGIHISAGEERKIPWVAIAPVVHAIRVLERIVPAGELLFSATHHDFTYQHGFPGALKGGTLHKRIRDFVAWANREAEARSLPEQTIPEDPHGEIGLARFRRSLAWHIARRPGGLIALAIQYGHMRTVLDARTSSGYGSRGRRGIHGVLDVETALAAADTAARLRDRVAAGEKVSGPAARRAITAAAQTPRFEGRIVPRTFALKAAKFLARDGVVLFDNPDTFLICAFKRDNALCEPDPSATAPRQYDCRPGCGNTIRTDTHARQLREHADELEELATHAPAPVAKRLRANAARLRETAMTHDATAEAPI